VIHTSVEPLRLALTGRTYLGDLLPPVKGTPERNHPIRTCRSFHCFPLTFGIYTAGIPAEYGRKTGGWLRSTKLPGSAQHCARTSPLSDRTSVMDSRRNPVRQRLPFQFQCDPSLTTDQCIAGRVQTYGQGASSASTLRGGVSIPRSC
jgi:hypothetical protein